MPSPNVESPSRAANGTWFKSTYTCGNGACVEVRYDNDQVSVRDSKYRRDPSNRLELEPTITVDLETWATFLDEVTGLSPATSNGPLTFQEQADGSVLLSSADGTSLLYTHVEWSAFFLGIRHHEFDHELVDA